MKLTEKARTCNQIKANHSSYYEYVTNYYGAQVEQGIHSCVDGYALSWLMYSQSMKGVDLISWEHIILIM